MSQSEERRESEPLAAKIARAITAVGGALEADKRNKSDGYDYVSADKILSACGQALASAGVIIVPEITQHTAERAEYSSRGGGGMRYEACVSMSMIVTDGRETLKLAWVGRGVDYSVPDKATAKAITMGHRYFVAKLLMVGQGNEDGEHEPSVGQPDSERERMLKRAAEERAARVVSSARQSQSESQPGGNGGGNGDAKKTAAQRWGEFVAAEKPSAEDIVAALGVASAGEWVKAKSGRDVQQAIDTMRGYLAMRRAATEERKRQKSEGSASND